MHRVQRRLRAECVILPDTPLQDGLDVVNGGSVNSARRVDRLRNPDLLVRMQAV